MMPATLPLSMLHPAALGAPPVVPVVTTDDGTVIKLLQQADDIVVRAEAWATFPADVIDAASRLRRTASTSGRDTDSFERRTRAALAVLRRVLSDHALDLLVGCARMSGGQVRPDTVLVVIGIAANGSQARALPLDAWVDLAS